MAYTLACAGALLVAAAPVTELRLGFDLDRASIAETDFGRGLAYMEADQISSALGVVLPHPAGTPPVDTAALVATLERDAKVAFTTSVDNGRDLTIVIVIIRTHIDEPATTALAGQITRQLVPATLPPGQDAFVTGPNVIFSDLMDETTTQLSTVVLLVLGCSMVFLLVTFRSILLPIKAVLMNLLAVTAAFGLLTLATRHLPHLVGSQVNTLIPLLAFTLVFGLSIDYEIFLSTASASTTTPSGTTPPPSSTACGTPPAPSPWPPPSWSSPSPRCSPRTATTWSSSASPSPSRSPWTRRSSDSLSSRP